MTYLFAFLIVFVPPALCSSFTNDETIPEKNLDSSPENASTSMKPPNFKKIRRSNSFRRGKSPLTKQFCESSTSGVHLIGDKEIDVNAVISLKVKQELLDEDHDLKSTDPDRKYSQQTWLSKQQSRYKDRVRRVCSSPRIESLNKSLNKSVNEISQKTPVETTSISDDPILIESSE